MWAARRRWHGGGGGGGGMAVADQVQTCRAAGMAGLVVLRRRGPWCSELAGGFLRGVLTLMNGRMRILMASTRVMSAVEDHGGSMIDDQVPVRLLGADVSESVGAGGGGG